MALQVMPYVHSPCRIGRGNPAAAANSGSECSGLRSPHIRYSSACCGDTGIDNSRSGARSGGSDEVDGPRSPPKPPSPRAKIERFWIHNGVPSGVVTVVSDQITAALPLSQMSVNLVTARPVPDGGSGAGADTASLACSTLLSSMSMPGNCTVGGLVSWKLAATLPNVGSTCGVSSTR